MVLFPSLYQEAGWLIVSLALLAICFLSYVCSVMIVEAMAAMPGNAAFAKRVEYTSLSFYYLGRYGYLVTQFFFQLSLACNNISSIIQSVQVMDFAIAAIFHRSCAVPEFYPHFSFHCPEAVSGDITVFGGIYVLSVGFLVTALVCVPMGLFNLDDNVVIQKVSCFLVCLMVAVWVVVFSVGGLDMGRVPAVGTKFTNVLGTTVFNFAVITSIPSWVNEKKEGTSILATMGVAMPMALALFTLTGIFGGAHYEFTNDQTMLNLLQDSSNVLTHITFYLFPCVVNLTSIPVFAIMQRYNLLEARVCGPKMANFLGVVLPWLVCIPFYTGSGFSEVVNWGGILFNSTVNFIIPPLIYISMVRKQTALAQRHALHDIRLLHGEGDDISTNKIEIDASVSVSQIVVQRADVQTASALSVNQLGPRGADGNASLKQSLLGGGGHFASSSGAYEPDGADAEMHMGLDARSEADEADETRMLGWNPEERAREEERIRDEAVRIAAAQLHKGHGHTLTVPSVRPRSVSPPLSEDDELPDPAVIAAHAVATLAAAGPDAVASPSPTALSDAFAVGPAPWRAMPVALLPYRTAIAKSIGALLLLITIAVIIQNIIQCASSSGCDS